MKTAISVPDSVFHEAEKAAKRLKLSRSQLYSKAVVAFIEQQGWSEVTERLNQVYGKAESRMEPALMRAQVHSLGEEDW